jgi:hypothetical protein
VNRLVWIVVSLVLIALGGLGILAHFGWLPGTDPDTPLLSPQAIQRWSDWGAGAITATIIAGLAVAFVGLLLLRLQLRRRGRADMPDIRVPAERAVLQANTPDWPTNAVRPATPAAGGLTPTALASGAEQPTGGSETMTTTSGSLRVDANALRHALAADLRKQRGVERADVQLMGQADEPRLRIWLTIDPNADLADLRERVANAARRFTVTAGRHAQVEDVTVRVANRPPARVR